MCGAQWPLSAGGSGLGWAGPGTRAAARCAADTLVPGRPRRPSPRPSPPAVPDFKVVKLCGDGPGDRAPSPSPPICRNRGP
jgi:hypothetical protein